MVFPCQSRNYLLHGYSCAYSTWVRNNLARGIHIAHKSPLAALTVIIVGLIAVVLVAFLSFLPIFYPEQSVDGFSQAKDSAERYAVSRGMEPEIKEIMEFSNHYYAIVMEKDTGVNAFEVLIDKTTGRVFLEPGPSMMWNTKYGHMPSRNPTAAMPITSEQATRNAQQWLDSNYPNAQAQQPETFYGYYTIDFSRDNQTIGMLSVNGYSGEIWYHTWHGQFIGMMEF